MLETKAEIVRAAHACEPGGRGGHALGHVRLRGQRFEPPGAEGGSPARGTHGLIAQEGGRRGLAVHGAVRVGCRHVGRARQPGQVVHARQRPGHHARAVGVHERVGAGAGLAAAARRIQTQELLDGERRPLVLAVHLAEVGVGVVVVVRAVAAAAAVGRDGLVVGERRHLTGR